MYDSDVSVQAKSLARSLRNWLLVAFLIAPWAALVWSANGGNNRLLLGAVAVSGLQLAIFVPIGRRWRKNHPEDAARLAQAQEAAVRRSKAQAKGQLRSKLIGLTVSQIAVLPVIVMSATNPAFHQYLPRNRLAVEAGGAVLVVALTLAVFAIFRPSRGSGAT